VREGRTDGREGKEKGGEISPPRSFLKVGTYGQYTNRVMGLYCYTEFAISSLEFTECLCTQIYVERVGKVFGSEAWMSPR